MGVGDRENLLKPLKGSGPTPVRLTQSRQFHHLRGVSRVHVGAAESVTALLGLFPGLPLRFRYLILLAVALLPGASCTSCDSEGGKGAIISREAFIQAYVELRVEALGTPGEELPLERRDQILENLGLSEEDLLNFVEARGRDIQFMRRVWEEVDSIMTERRGVPEAPGSRGTP
jgi:hypothetical protein